jgi:hypothetical protein
MSDQIEDENVPLTKQKRYYEKTPARLEAIKKLVESRRKQSEISKAQKLLKAEAVLKENNVEVEPPKKPELKREASTFPDSRDEEELRNLIGDDYDKDAQIIIVKKKKPKKKIIIEESDTEDDEPIIIKKKREPKENVTLTKQAPSRVLKINTPPPVDVEKIDYSKMFC